MVTSVLIVSASVTWGLLRSLRRRRPCSARRPPHERADPRLLGGTQLLQREGGRPHDAFVEVRCVVEAERRVPRVELLGSLALSDDLAEGVSWPTSFALKKLSAAEETRIGALVG